MLIYAYGVQLIM